MDFRRRGRPCGAPRPPRQENLLTAIVPEQSAGTTLAFFSPGATMAQGWRTPQLDLGPALRRCRLVIILGCSGASDLGRAWQRWVARAAGRRPIVLGWYGKHSMATHAAGEHVGARFWDAVRALDPDPNHDLATICEQRKVGALVRRAQGNVQELYQLPASSVVLARRQKDCKREYGPRRGRDPQRRQVATRGLPQQRGRDTGPGGVMKRIVLVEVQGRGAVVIQSDDAGSLRYDRGTRRVTGFTRITFDGESYSLELEAANAPVRSGTKSAPGHWDSESEVVFSVAPAETLNDDTLELRLQNGATAIAAVFHPNALTPCARGLWFGITLKARAGRLLADLGNDAPWQPESKKGGVYFHTGQNWLPEGFGNRQTDEAMLSMDHWLVGLALVTSEVEKRIQLGANFTSGQALETIAQCLLTSPSGADASDWLVAGTRATYAPEASPWWLKLARDRQLEESIYHYRIETWLALSDRERHGTPAVNPLALGLDDDIAVQSGNLVWSKALYWVASCIRRASASAINDTLLDWMAIPGVFTAPANHLNLRTY